MLTALAVLTTPLASAATAEAMGQAVLYLLLYAFALCLPIPYSFVLAAYALLLQTHPVKKPNALVLVSILIMLFVASVVATITFQGVATATNAWDIVRGANIIAAILIAVLGYLLITLGKTAVVLALMPLSLILSVLCFFLIKNLS